MNAFPADHWNSATLGDLALEIRNGLPEKPHPEPPGNPILRISAVRPGKVDFSDLRYHRSAQSSASYVVNRGDLLIVRYNGNARFVAACGMVRDSVDGCVYPDKLIRVRIDPAQALPEYIELAMLTPESRRQLEPFIKTAAGQHGISAKDLRRLRIRLPPLAEQRRIVARIESLFACTRRARTDLERIAPLSRRYVEATTDRAFLPDEDAGWTTSTAGQLCDIKSGLTLGKRYTAETELVERPYLRVANVQRGHLRLNEIKTVRLAAAEAARLVLRDGDVLMNEGGDRDKLGRGWVWEGQIPNCVHQNHVFRLRLRSNVVTPKFMSRYANHAGARYFLDEGKQTTNLASISMSKVAALPVPVPPKCVAARIDALLDTADASARILQAEATRALALLDRLEQSVLARAFRGELVPAAPAEEADMESQVPVEKDVPARSRRKVRAFAA